MAKTASSSKPKKPETKKGRVDDAVSPISDLPKRKLGLRGAAPWAARHAAKHAAEARARAAEPAPPGSARATLRTPSDAESIKTRITELYTLTQKIRLLKKRLDKSFFEIGEVLNQIQTSDLHVAKGFGNFETFLEREVDIGKQTCVKLMKLAQVMHREAALDYGMERCLAAISALDGDFIPRAASTPGLASSRVQALPMKPPSVRVASF